jgi:hypothetical protein
LRLAVFFRRNEQLSCDSLDFLPRHSAGPEHRWSAFDETDDGRFKTDAAWPVIENRQIVAKAIAHVRGAGWRRLTGAICAGRGDRCANSLQQRLGDRMGRDAQCDGRQAGTRKIMDWTVVRALKHKG